jgi:predicted RNA-binding protein Jag
MESDRNSQGKAVDEGLVARLVNGVKYVVAGVKPDTWFGPGQPIEPTAQEVEGRAFDYPVGFNYRITPRQEEAVSFETLRALSVNLPILASVIETRKDQMNKLPWGIVPNDMVMSNDEIEAKSDWLEQEIRETKQFFLFPDKENDYQTWSRMIFDDLFVIDAPTIYPRKNKGGGVYAFEPMDGALFKRVLNKDGRTPVADSVAYQQILHGLPAVDYSRDELIYKPRNKRTWKIYGYCYDSKTEILTKDRGFVLFKDLRVHDYVATRNPETREFEWQKPYGIINEHYDGEMIKFSSRSVDLLVTPEHRMLVSIQNLKRTGTNEKIMSARDMSKDWNNERKIPVTSYWESGVKIGSKVFAASGITNIKSVFMSGDDYCALMGVYLAEGNIKTTGGIEISQQKESKGFNAYKNLIERINEGKSGHNGKAFIISKGALTEHFKQFGYAEDKFVPDEIRNAPQSQLKIFFDHFVLGDGSFEKRPNKSGRGNHPENGVRITTVSKQLSDHLVEIAQKLGWSASVRERPESIKWVASNKKMSLCQKTYVINIRYSQAMSAKPTVIDYNGTIHCVSVPNGIVYVRRNGQPCWSGNSPVEQIIFLINMALRRELSKLEYYCYSDDTEVLTKRGWLKFPDTNKDDEFATRQLGTGIFEWQKSFDFFRKEYDGEMVEIKGKSIDLLVTPNHRMLVDCLPQKLWLERGKPKSKTEHVVSAEDLIEKVNETKNGTKNIGIPQTSIWNGNTIKEKVFTGGPKSKLIVMDGDDYCAFMGMYLAEGNVRRNGICIAQPIDHRASHHIYKTLLIKIFGNVSFSGEDTLEVTSKAVAEFLRPFGCSDEKFIPDDILNSTPSQLKIFWNYYYLGDGRADGDDFKMSQQAFTVSKKLADNLTEILQKMGYSSTVWIRKSGKAKIGERIVNAKEGYLITLGRRKVTKGWHAKKVSYKGFVTCVSVPNTFLYVRRNGKQVWSGNTSGTLPDAIVSVPETWTAKQVLQFQVNWDDLMSGNLKERRKLRFVPGKVDVHPFKEAILKDEFDEWIARVVCFVFSISPLPFIKQTNRSTSQTMHQQALQEGLMPLKQWDTDLKNLMLWKYMQKPHLRFQYSDEDDVDPEVQAQIDDSDLKTGVKTIDEVRQSRGLKPYDKGLGAKPLIYTASGAVLLEDVVSGKLRDMQQEAQQQKAIIGQFDDSGKPKQIEHKPSTNGNGKSQITKSDIDALYKVKKKSFSLDGRTYYLPNRNSKK